MTATPNLSFRAKREILSDPCNRAKFKLNHYPSSNGFGDIEQGLLLPAGVGSSEHFMRFFGDSLLCFQSTFEADHADFGV